MERSDLVQILRRKEICEEDLGSIANIMFEEVWGRLLPVQILTEKLSSTLAGNVVTPPGEPIPDCLTCGACCGAFVLVRTQPETLVDEEDCWTVVKPGKRGSIPVDRLIRRKESDFSCVALEGNIGERSFCKIYDRRPSECRRFEAGSDRCHALRRAYGFEPFLSLNDMSEALKKLEQSGKSNDQNAIKRAIIEECEDSARRIIAELNDGSMHQIHEFDPTQEVWYQSVFEGLSLESAAQLIKERTNFSASL